MLHGDMNLKGMSIERLQNIIKEADFQEQQAIIIRKRAKEKLRRMCEKAGHQPYKPYSYSDVQYCKICEKRLGFAETRSD